MIRQENLTVTDRNVGDHFQEIHMMKNPIKNVVRNPPHQIIHLVRRRMKIRITKILVMRMRIKMKVY